MARGGSWTSAQLHHVIPEELGQFLAENFSLEWEETFITKTVPMAQVGSHPIYTATIKSILQAHPGSSKAILIQFANNLIAEITANYQGYQPNDIPAAALQNCFPGAAPATSSSGRIITPVSWN